MIGFQEKQDVILWSLFGTLKPAINHKIKITQIAFAFPEKPQLMFFLVEKKTNNTLPLAHRRSKPPLDPGMKVFAETHTELELVCGPSVHNGRELHTVKEKVKTPHFSSHSKMWLLTVVVLHNPVVFQVHRYNYKQEYCM